MLTEKQIMLGGGVERFRVGEKEEVIPHILRIKNGNIDLEKKMVVQNSCNLHLTKSSRGKIVNRRPQQKIC